MNFMGSGTFLTLKLPGILQRMDVIPGTQYKIIVGSELKGLGSDLKYLSHRNPVSHFSD